MDIKEYLEKLKNYKVAENLKRITATALVTGTILTGAGLTACEQKPNMSNEELASGIVNVLQEQKEDFELSKIIFGCIDDQYLMLVGNSDITDYVGYEISKSQFNKLLKLACEKESEYIQLSPNADSFVITKGGINDENLKEFNEIIYSTISKGNTIDVSKYIQSGNNQTNNGTDQNSNANTSRHSIEHGIKTFTDLYENEFNDFKADYFLISPQKELTRKEGDTIVGSAVVDCFEIIDVYSKNGNEKPDTKKVLTFIPTDNFDMASFLNLLESRIDNERIKKINNEYLVDFSLFDDEKMLDLSAYFIRIVNGSGMFLHDFCYEAPLQEGEFTQEESEQER